MATKSDLLQSEPLFAEYAMSRAERFEDTQECNLFTRNLLPEVTEEQLKQLFSQFGLILSLKIISPVNSIFQTNYAFLSFCSKEEAQRALIGCHQQRDIKLLYKNRAIFITTFLSKKERKRFLELKQNAAKLKKAQFTLTNLYQQQKNQKQQQQLWGYGFPNPSMPYFQQNYMYNQPLPFGPQKNLTNLDPPNQPQGLQKPTAQQFQQQPQPQQSQSQAQANPSNSSNSKNNQNEKQPNQPRKESFHKRDAQVNNASSNKKNDISSSKQKKIDEMKEKCQTETGKRQVWVELGNQVYPLVNKHIGFELSQQITGMLLDFEVFTIEEIYRLIEDQTFLVENIGEAKRMIETDQSGAQ